MTIFIHIPKTAGLSVLKSSGIKSHRHLILRWVDWEEGTPILSAIRNPYDRIVSVYYFLHKMQNEAGNFNRRLQPQKHKISSFDGVNQWVDYFYNNQNEYTGSQSPETKRALWVMQCFFHQQINYINEADGEPVSERITDILRYETLADDWAAYALLHDLPPLQHKNKSELRPSTPWQEELTAESIAKIGELYADDFEHLNYERIS